MQPLSIRHATINDRDALERLAQLDSAEVPLRPLLVAEVDGELVAALSLRGGDPIADPFRPTGALVDLLRLRARQLDGAESVEDRPGPVSRPRLIPGRLPAIP